jgi:hypothetical protein
MFDKLAAIEARQDELVARLGTPELQADPGEYRKAAKTLSELEPLVGTYREFKTVERDIAGAQELVAGSDPEMRALAEDELRTLQARREALLQDLQVLLIPKDPTTRRTSCSRSAPVPAATKRRCSPPTSSACTVATPSAMAGSWRCCRAARATPAGSRR